MAEELQMVEGSLDYELESQNGYLMEFNMTLLQICHISNSSILNQLQNFTGKSLSEALIFASNNQQYDDRLFIELQVQNMKTTSKEHEQNMFCACSFHVLNW